MNQNDFSFGNKNIDEEENKNLKNVLNQLKNQNRKLEIDNITYNSKIIDLTKLLKHKDKKINLINLKLSQLILQKYLYKKFIFIQNILKKKLNLFYRNIITLKIHELNFSLTNNLLSNKNKKIMELNNFTNKNNKRDIGVGNYNLKEKFYIRKELCLTFLSKWRFVKRSKEQKEEMEKWLKISKSKNLNIQIKSENNNNNNLNPEHFFMIEKNNISFINKNIKKIKPIIKSNNNNLVINSFNLNNIKEKKSLI